MKKTYSKPVIMFESFMLSTNIAGTCGDQAELLSAIYTCGKLFSNGMKVFMGDMTGCDHIKVVPDRDGDGQWGTFCYHIPVTETLVTS